VREELDRGLGRLERGDAGGDEFLPRLFDELLPQPAGDDGLFGVFFFLDDGFGHGGGVGHGLRREDDEHPVDFGRFEHDLEGLAVALGVSIAQDVEGVAVRQDSGRKAREPPEGVVAEFGQRDFEVGRTVGRHRP